MVADLQNDYINPIEMSEKLNSFWFPDLILYAFFDFRMHFSSRFRYLTIYQLVFLVFGYWLMLVLHLPLLVYLILTYVNILKTYHYM